VQSELGSAPAIGRALDELEHERIVGTLAGDDTCLVVAPSERDARALARELAEIVA
jgi:transcriptional regulator of arginine metabolism